MPPSAITVCALPSSDLQTSPTLTPCAAASIAARNPAPPAPITSTSCSCSMYSALIGPTAQKTSPQRRGDAEKCSENHQRQFPAFLCVTASLRQDSWFCSAEDSLENPHIMNDPH